MAASPPTHRVRIPAGSRDWLLPLADPRARALHSIDIRIAGISEARSGFDWSGPGVNHLVLGTIQGEGLLEAGGLSLTIREGDLILSPAGVPRRYAARAAHWRFLAIRLADAERWRYLLEQGVRSLPGRWLRRLAPPVEGMLAEHPLGSAVPSDTHRSQHGGESPAEYVLSRYAGRMFEAGANEEYGEPRADAFELHATILRHQIEGMLARRLDSERHDEAIVLASLWGRVADRPRGPWNAEDLASTLGVSRTSLYRMVKSHHAASPGRVVTRLRMDEACRLLVQSRHSIEVIADQVGYASAFSFSAAFKRCVGKPPSLFRLDAIRGAGRE